MPNRFEVEFRFTRLRDPNRSLPVLENVAISSFALISFMGSSSSYPVSSTVGYTTSCTLSCPSAVFVLTMRTKVGAGVARSSAGATRAI